MFCSVHAASVQVLEVLRQQPDVSPMLWFEELFVVAFEEFFVVGWRVSGLADDKAVPRCFDDLDRDYPGVVDA